MNAYQYREDERILHFFPLYHGNGGSNLLGPIILVGGTIVLQEKFSASRFIADLVRTRATMTALNASHVKLILKQPESIYDRAHDVRRVQFGLPLDLERRMQFEERFGIRLVESYGQTECLGMAAASPVCANRTVASAGPPVPGVQLQIVNSDGEALPAGSPGEIRLKADSRHGLCLGYFGNEEATQRLFSDGWLKTGDVGYIDSSGSLVFLERQKDMIKRSGFNVAAAEVERVILEHPAVTECAVVSVPDDIQDEAIVAFVVSTTALTPEEIISFCVDRLAMYKTPSHVQFLEYLPEGFVGKIDKQELRLRARQAFGMEHGDVNSV
jgi:crotonobetaine/carnitine-CoA ligase